MNFKIPFLNKNRNKKEVNNKNDTEYSLDEIIRMLKNEEETENLSESTYFICLKVLSEALGKLPIKAYKKTDKGGKAEVEHDALQIINFRPNPYTTASTFWANVEMCRNHYGNAYVYLHFSKGKLKGMYLLENEKVKVLIDNENKFKNGFNKVYYRYENRVFNCDDILHFKTSMSKNGITGLSVGEQLAGLIGNAKESDLYLNSLLKGGLTAKGVLEYTSDLDRKSIEKALEFMGIGFGAKNAGGLIPIPPGFSMKPINLTLNDTQFLENKKFTSQQIAGAFGVKPYFLNEYKSGLNSNEHQSLSFYVDTLLFILKHYEEEICYKLLHPYLDKGVFFKFNEKAILRVSAKEQIEILQAGVNNGIYQPNEARNYLNLDGVDGGDILMCNGNYIPITEVGNQYKNTAERRETDERKEQEKQEE